VVVFGGALGASLVGVVACSGGGDDMSGTDSGPKKDGTVGSDTGPGVDSGGDSSGKDGGKIYCDSGLSFHPSPDAGPYCPFQAGDAAFSSCSLGQKCCEPLSADGGPSTCINGNQSCPQGVTSWECDEKSDCMGQNVCCIQANGALKEDGLCIGQAFVTQVTGSVCKSACSGVVDGGTSEAPLCSGQADCPNGTTCLKFSKQSKQLGVCL
jgi:hypothetical protein